MCIRREALAGMDFNKIWANCVCGNDGKPVSDGPFILTNYTRGQGTTLKANPFWYGKKPALKRDRLQDHHRHQLRGAGDARR